MLNVQQSAAPWELAPGQERVRAIAATFVPGFLLDCLLTMILSTME